MHASIRVLRGHMLRILHGATFDLKGALIAGDGAAEGEADGAAEELAPPPSAQASARSAQGSAASVAEAKAALRQVRESWPMSCLMTAW